MSREFTPRAKLEFQNYNELPHAFERRISAATSKSNIYLNQFPNHMVLILARFVGFVCGSVMAVLILFTVVDNELSLEFEITKNKTVLFYLGLLGAIVAGCRTVSNKSSPTYANNYTRVHPAWILRDVLEDLQYIPESWQNRLHTTWVKSQFLGLFDLKVVVFLHEILGIFTTPFVLMTSLSRSSIHIIDFFRENTKTLDKVGFVCKYADFELVDLNNSMQRSSRSSLSKKGNMLKSRIFDEVGNNAKMEMSFLQFKSEYPTWMPQNDQSVAFLGAAQEVEAEIMRERESFMFERPLPNLAGDVSTHLPYYEKNNFANKYSDRIRLNQSILPSGASIVLPNPVPKNKTGHKLPEGSSPHKGSIRNRASNKYEANQSKLFLSDLPLVNSQYDPNNGEASLNNSIYIPNNSTKANFFNYFSPGIFSVVNKLNSKNIF
ncbi:Autophagy-related protein 9 [Zancudomyces culisetae]|uniref:Autophagy-related protein 9 n=1 Tax=Zancudomyces culisetae TaxID=1213189 RepID=A0A1R1PIS9_ZANCU|nr:Autophagy-related protein 9 [Zancudomyces culisetae]|eukprot:OMH80848.1 Autophagy-related protein 9 [Zancudomyces culisetae]